MLFSKCEVLMTGRNEQLRITRIRAADQFRNHSRGHRGLQADHEQQYQADMKKVNTMLGCTNRCLIVRDVEWPFLPT